MSKLEQTLRIQLLRCDLGMKRGCYGENNPIGECPFCDDPYVCPIPKFIRTCLGIPQPWEEDSEFIEKGDKDEEV